MALDTSSTSQELAIIDETEPSSLHTQLQSGTARPRNFFVFPDELREEIYSYVWLHKPKITIKTRGRTYQVKYIGHLPKSEKTSLLDWDSEDTSELSTPRADRRGPWFLANKKMAMEAISHFSKNSAWLGEISDYVLGLKSQAEPTEGLMLLNPLNSHSLKLVSHVSRMKNCPQSSLLLADLKAYHIPRMPAHLPIDGGAMLKHCHFNVIIQKKVGKNSYHHIMDELGHLARHQLPNLQSLNFEIEWQNGQGGGPVAIRQLLDKMIKWGERTMGCGYKEAFVPQHEEVISEGVTRYTITCSPKWEIHFQRKPAEEVKDFGLETLFA